MLEFLFLIAALAIGGFLLLALLLKALVGLVFIPFKLAAVALKVLLGILVVVPVVIFAVAAGAILLPMAAILVPVLLLLAVPLLIAGLFVAGVLKLVF